MSENSDKPDDSDPEDDNSPSEGNRNRRPRGRILTAKDAGWMRPGLFVAPVKFVPIDPPEPRSNPPQDPK